MKHASVRSAVSALTALVAAVAVSGGAGTAAAAPPPTVAATVDPGWPVMITYDGDAKNDLGQPASAYMLIGDVYADGAAPAQLDGPETCAQPGDAVIPFYVEAVALGTGPTTLSLQFSQTIGGLADATQFPMTIEFHDADMGRRCMAATEPDLGLTQAVYQWEGMPTGETAFGNGYFIMHNYWDAAGVPVGQTSAVVAVAPVIDDRLTENLFTQVGATPKSFVDAASGETYLQVNLIAGT